MRLCAKQKPEGITGAAQAAIESVCDIQLSCTGKKGDVTHWSLCVWGEPVCLEAPLYCFVFYSIFISFSLYYFLLYYIP